MRPAPIARAMLAALTPILLLTVLTAAPAASQTGDDTAFAASVNSRRASAGRAPLIVSGALSGSACQQSQRMAAAGALSHTSNLSAAVNAVGGNTAGENVGYGSSVSQLMGMFMGSGAHASNILNPDFTHFASCTVRGGDGWMYTTHVFVGVPGGAVPPPAPPPPAPPSPAPPAPAPAPPAPAPPPAEPAAAPQAPVPAPPPPAPPAAAPPEAAPTPQPADESLSETETLAGPPDPMPGIVRLATIQIWLDEALEDEG